MTYEALLIVGQIFPNEEEARSYFKQHFNSLNESSKSEISRYGFSNFIMCHGESNWPAGGEIKCFEYDDGYTHTRFYIGYEIDVSHVASCETSISESIKHWRYFFNNTPDIHNLIVMDID